MKANKDIEKLFDSINDLYKANTKIQKEMASHAKYMREVSDRTGQLEDLVTDLEAEIDILKQLSGLKTIYKSR